MDREDGVGAVVLRAGRKDALSRPAGQRDPDRVERDLDGQYPEKPANDIWGLEGRFTTAKKAAVVLRTGLFNSCTATTATYHMTLTS